MVGAFDEAFEGDFALGLHGEGDAVGAVSAGFVDLVGGYGQVVDDYGGVYGFGDGVELFYGACVAAYLGYY